MEFSNKMSFCRQSILIFSVVFLFVVAGKSATPFKVTCVKELNEAILKVKPGEKIVMSNGVWKDVELLFNAKGTQTAPIEISAESFGKVFIEGVSNLRISGENLIVSGFVFRNGHTPTSEVISFREKNGVYGNHCRLTQCVIDDYNHSERFETDHWVALYGKENRVDHCYFVDKRNQGVTMVVHLPDEKCRNNSHIIDHNYFGFREILGSNGGETMRLGVSEHSLSLSGTRVEDNFFEHCNGEHEIISNKSCGNVFRHNTFWECQGTLTFRHGHDNLAEGNFFFGNGKSNIGGIRIINERNKAVNNYFYQLTGYRFRGALVIMNGVPNSPINRYNQVIDGVFSNNTFIDCDYFQLCAGKDKERTARPIDTKIENNIFFNQQRRANFTAYDDISGILFRNNYICEDISPIADKGFSVAKMKLVRNEYGIQEVVSSTIKNAGSDLKRMSATSENTGVNWYPKKSEDLSFDSGKRREVDPGDNTLVNAIKNSNPGDVLVLKSGEYRNNKDICITHAITVLAAPGHKPLLLTEKNYMFSIENEGALKLSGLELSGKASPDMAGNCIVTTSKYSMNRNYKLIVENCEVKDLNVNYGFDFFKAFKNTMADSIVVRNCHFKNITGSIMELDKEYEDLGIYNAESIVLEGSSFKGVQNSVLTIYRGGTDESTFGPNVIISDCTMSNCGKGQRNKGGNVLYLHGVQMAHVTNLNLLECADFRLFLTNGEPVTRINTLNIYPKADIVSNNCDYELTGLTHSITKN